MSAPHKPIPDTLPACQAYCRELLEELREAQRKAAQQKIRAGVWHQRWLMLHANAVDADRQGRTIDVLDHMRAIAADCPLE